MPIVQIRYNHNSIPNDTLVALRERLPAVAATSLTCAESIELMPQHIYLEFDRGNVLDINCKDLNIRVLVHDYPGRRKALDRMREQIAQEVVKHLPEGVTWYVWVILVTSSYGSDTEKLSFSPTENN